MGFGSFLKGLLGKEQSDTPARTLPTEHRDGFVAVLHTDDLKVGEGCTVRVGERDVAVFLTPKGWFAVDDICPHEGGALGDGDPEGTTVLCPLHDWRFDLTNGACLHHPDHPVECFQVREQEGVVWVKAP